MSVEPGDGWDAYLDSFHEQRPGITEDVLAVSVDDTGRTGYDWLASLLPTDGLIVDLACGSAPLWRPELRGRYHGIDASPAEISKARARGAETVSVGDARALPFPDGAARAVVCSMALMVLPELETVLDEVRRVLAPDGVLLALVPTHPTRPADLLISGKLLSAVHGGLGYRNDRQLRHAASLLRTHGLELTEDRITTYRFGLGDGGAELLARSLYLRNGHVEDAVAYLRRLARSARTMPIPLRQLVAQPAVA